MVNYRIIDLEKGVVYNNPTPDVESPASTRRPLMIRFSEYSRRYVTYTGPDGANDGPDAIDDPDAIETPDGADETPDGADEGPDGANNSLDVIETPDGADDDSDDIEVSDDRSEYCVDFVLTPPKDIQAHYERVMKLADLVAKKTGVDILRFRSLTGCKLPLGIWREMMSGCCGFSWLPQDQEQVVSMALGGGLVLWKKGEYAASSIDFRSCYPGIMRSHYRVPNACGYYIVNAEELSDLMKKIADTDPLSSDFPVALLNVAMPNQKTAGELEGAHISVRAWMTSYEIKQALCRGICLVVNQALAWYQDATVTLNEVFGRYVNGLYEARVEAAEDAEIAGRIKSLLNLLWGGLARKRIIQHEEFGTKMLSTQEQYFASRMPAHVFISPAAVVTPFITSLARCQAVGFIHEAEALGASCVYWHTDGGLFTGIDRERLQSIYEGMKGESFGAAIKDKIPYEIVDGTTVLAVEARDAVLAYLKADTKFFWNSREELEARINEATGLTLKPAALRYVLKLLRKS